MPDDEERIALFLDYENLAIGARDALGGAAFDLRPVADALAERGRVVVRKAYADWSYFDDGRRMLTRHHVELIEIPQRMGATRKNAADIKMAVDAIELCFERDYITTFVLGTGDSDFTPLVNKLRELNRRVIGFGVEASTSALLPAACDEFLFYERLEGVEALPRRAGSAAARPLSTNGSTRRRGGRSRTRRVGVGEAEGEVVPAGDEVVAEEPRDLAQFVMQTLAGMERSGSGPVRASMLKRAILRKDPTFAESTYGFRAFGELLRHLASDGAIAVTDGPVAGDPDVAFPQSGDVEDGFELLLAVVSRLSAEGRPVPLSGLKTQLRKVQPDFSEKRFGYNGFLAFCRAGEARALIAMPYDDEAEDYLLTVLPGAPSPAASRPQIGDRRPAPALAAVADLDETMVDSGAGYAAPEAVAAVLDHLREVEPDLANAEPAGAAAPAPRRRRGTRLKAVADDDSGVPAAIVDASATTPDDRPVPGDTGDRPVPGDTGERPAPSRRGRAKRGSAEPGAGELAAAQLGAVEPEPVSVLQPLLESASSGEPAFGEPARSRASRAPRAARSKVVPAVEETPVPEQAADEAPAAKRAPSRRRKAEAPPQS